MNTPEPSDLDAHRAPRTEVDARSNPLSLDTSPTGSRLNETDPSVAPESLTLDPPKRPGEIGVFGKYRVLKELGHGGMGAVYLAYDEHLNRRVALKVMLPSAAAQPGAKERFLREARATAALDHENIVTVYDASEFHGIPFIAIKYLQGLSLQDYLKQKGNPDIQQTMQLARDLLNGLKAAHTHGLIHRDIKPANIWLEAPDGKAKILDFGLAKPLDEQGVELTKQGTIMGTPAFMSPEQAAGEKTDPRTDLFSLGVVLYRLLSGRMPYPGDNVMAILTSLIKEEPKPLMEVNPAVPFQLAELVHDLLAKAPNDRPQSAEEALQRLNQIDLNASASHPSRPGLPRASADQKVVYVPLPISAQYESAFENLEDATVLLKSSELSTRQLRLQKSRNQAMIFAGVGGIFIVMGAIVAVALMGRTPKGDDSRQAREKTHSKVVDVEKKPNVFDEWKPEDPQWMAEFQKVKPEVQVALFKKEAKKANPEFKGTINHKDDGKHVTELSIQYTGRLADISAVAVFRQLEVFRWDNWTNSGDLQNLKPLIGLPLKEIVITGSKVDDVSPLANMPLHRVEILHSPQLKSNEPFRRMPLQNIRGHFAEDFSPLAGKSFDMFWGGDHLGGHDLAPMITCQIRHLVYGFPWKRCPNALAFLRECRLQSLHNE